MEPIRIYVGADRSQELAVKVLEHSIKRHTNRPVQLSSLSHISTPQPKNPRNWSRTNFSFARFAIPKLNQFQGKAIYLDADMQVFADIGELWDMPFEGAKVIIQAEIPERYAEPAKKHAPDKRIKQCSVMLLDCERLPWDMQEIVHGLDGKYSYEELMYQFCLLKEDEIKYGVPFEWNSLETYEAGTTKLIHYTDMITQPWVSPENPNGHIWMKEVRDMLTDGSLTLAEIKKEIDLGYFRPSLFTELQNPERYGALTPDLIEELNKIDDDAGFIMHRELHERKKRHKKAASKANRSWIKKLFSTFKR